MVLTGTFRESPTDPHVAARRRLLDRGAPVPTLQAPIVEMDADRPAEDCVGPMRAALARDGLAQIQFVSPPSVAEFRAIGEALGAPVPERAAEIQDFVEDGTVLHLKPRFDARADVALQPFSTRYLSLHSESSGAALALQPRYLLFLCLEPGGTTTEARTVLIPMDAVASRLSERDLEILKSTRYARNVDGPTIARTDERAATAFSFRDFQDQPLEWSSEAQDATGDEVDEALRALLAALYDNRSARAIAWRRGALIAVDNFRFLHGRTAGADAPDDACDGTGRHRSAARHLMRMRIRC